MIFVLPITKENLSIMLAFLLHSGSPVSPFQCTFTLTIWMPNDNSSGFKGAKSERAFEGISNIYFWCWHPNISRNITNLNIGNVTTVLIECPFSSPFWETLRWFKLFFSVSQHSCSQYLCTDLSLCYVTLWWGTKDMD